MNFGELEIATLWRVWKDGVCRRAAMLERGKGARLVVLESDRIVQWETFAGAAQLRDRAGGLYAELRKLGWTPSTHLQFDTPQRPHAGRRNRYRRVSLLCQWDIPTSTKS